MVAVKNVGNATGETTITNTIAPDIFGLADAKSVAGARSSNEIAGEHTDGRVTFLFGRERLYTNITSINHANLTLGDAVVADPDTEYTIVFTVEDDRLSAAGRKWHKNHVLPPQRAHGQEHGAKGHRGPPEGEVVCGPGYPQIDAPGKGSNGRRLASPVLDRVPSLLDPADSPMDYTVSRNSRLLSLVAASGPEHVGSKVVWWIDWELASPRAPSRSPRGRPIVLTMSGRMRWDRVEEQRRMRHPDETLDNGPVHSDRRGTSSMKRPKKTFEESSRTRRWCRTSQEEAVAKGEPNSR